MPSSLLFSINNEGRVHSLSTSGSMWREIPYGGQEFKKLAAIPHFLWALGGDHQVYVYVHGLDVPIRVREETYENERWLPIEGFSDHLLPTDRFHFSNQEGTVERTIDKIRLPSMAWQWEGDWQLELTLNGQQLDHDGWSYAVDFPGQYYPKKQWKSCVRRRLWVRIRRYSAMNSWCAIAPLHKDATSEPFIDITVGGHDIPGISPGIMLVWAVTSNNRIMFRTEVSTRLPEGQRWIAVDMPNNCEPYQISVGRTGLLWVSLLDGHALVRCGVTRECLMGEKWVEVDAPQPSVRIIQVSVGTCSVWAVSSDKHVWFRNGVRSDCASISEKMATGNNWVEMTGKLFQISVASNDQVFGVGADDRLIYMRYGINNNDQTGKRWKALHAPLQLSRASSSASLSRSASERSCRSSAGTMNRPNSMIESHVIHEWNEEDDQSAHSAPTTAKSLTTEKQRLFETQPRHTKAWSAIHSVGSIVGMEVHESVDESAWSVGSTRNDSSGIFGEEEDELGWADYEAPWGWVTAGACNIEPNTGVMPNWFADVSQQHNNPDLQSVWRNDILRQLKARSEQFAALQLDQYQLAIDDCSWVYTTEARISMGGVSATDNVRFIDCIVQLEWTQLCGSLTVLQADGASVMYSCNLNDLAMIQNCSEPGNARLGLRIPRHHPPFLRLQFGSDKELEEWQAHFLDICNRLHGNEERPSIDSSVWACTRLGEVFVWDSSQTQVEQMRDNDKMHVQKYDLSSKSLPQKMPLFCGCAPGTVIVLTGCITDNAERFAVNLEAPSNYLMQPNKTFIERENVCLHFNPRFKENVIVRNSMSEGTWQQEETSGGLPLACGCEFTLKIECTEDAFVISIDGKMFTHFRHRLSPYCVTMLSMWGKMQPFRVVIKSPNMAIDPLDVYWCRMGGHLRRIETCVTGIVWATGYDHTAWVYNNGWGGGNDRSELDSFNVLPMTDSRDYRVYENQRWNPVSGYTSTGLPTDRYMWSDRSGRRKRTREQVKLLSSKWHWVSDWLVDFHVPGGVDRDGWQYAVDFPATYHAQKHFTDLVRRRRWYRRCSIATSGPWEEVGHTKLLDFSMAPVPYSTIQTMTTDGVCDSSTERDVIALWALASDGQPVFRLGVTRTNNKGVSWEHVSVDNNFISISCGPFDRVWAVSRKGAVYVRMGITTERLQGEKWAYTDAPVSAFTGQLKQISTNHIGIWAVDHLGNLHARRDEHHKWQTVYPDPVILNSAPHTTGFKQVSVGQQEVWALTDSGVIARRTGICEKTTIGTGWSIGIPGDFEHITIRAFK